MIGQELVLSLGDATHVVEIPRCASKRGVPISIKPQGQEPSIGTRIPGHISVVHGLILICKVQALLRFGSMIGLWRIRICAIALDPGPLKWKLNEREFDNAECRDGNLVMVTSAKDLPPAEVVANYEELADVKSGFRVLKSDFEFAAVHHRLLDRIRAHALISFIALLLHRVMRLKLRSKGIEASPQTILKEFEFIQKVKFGLGKGTKGVTCDVGL